MPPHLRRAVAETTSAALRRLPEDLPWFPRLRPEHRRDIEGLAAEGVSAFFRWYVEPSGPITARSILAGAPPDLSRSITLQETIELIQAIVGTLETEVTTLVPEAERDALRIAALRYSNEVAFSAAKVYARAAETRGAWDARLEATVVDALLRGSREPSIVSRTAALGWREAVHVVGVVLVPDPAIPGAPARIAPGSTDSTEPGGASGAPHLAAVPAPDEESGNGGGAGDASATPPPPRPVAVLAQEVSETIRRNARRDGVDLLMGVHGDRVVLILGAATMDRLDATLDVIFAQLVSARAAVGPAVADVLDAGASLRPAISALTVAPAWPHADRTVHADELLPERAMAGEELARRVLVERIYEPLRGAQSPLLHTLDAYWSCGLAMEATARSLFVHPNTVRYRLHRVAELVGWDPTDPREGFVVRIGVTLGRLPEPS